MLSSVYTSHGHLQEENAKGALEESSVRFRLHMVIFRKRMLRER
jgi:hypothetical protein